MASKVRDEKTISDLRSELLAAETLLNAHRMTIKELRSDKSIPKELQDEADQYAREDKNQINKLKEKLDSNQARKETSPSTTVTPVTPTPPVPPTPPVADPVEPIIDAEPTEPAAPETTKTSVEEEVEMESKTNLGQIKSRIAANNLRFSRAQTELYKNKTAAGHTEFKEELSNIVVSLNVVANDIADLEFINEEYTNKDTKAETPEQKGKRNKRNEESGKKFDNEKATLNDKVSRLTEMINKIIGGGKSVEDIIKEIGVGNSDKLIKISEKAKLTKVEADKLLAEVKETLKKKGTGKGFSDLEKQDFANKLSALFVDNTAHRDDLSKIIPTPGKVVEAARYGLVSDMIASIAYVMQKAEETLEKKNEISADEKFEKYQKSLKEERVKMLAKKLEIQKLDLEYKQGVEAEKVAEKKEKLSILSQVEAEKKLAKAEHRKPNMKGIDTAALKLLRPMRRFFQFRHKAYKLNRESLCNEARGLMDEVAYNYHRVAEFEGKDLNEENSANFLKTFTSSANFKNKTETQYEIDATADVISNKGWLKAGFKDMIGSMLEDGNGWGAVGAGLVMGAAMGTSAVEGGVKGLFTENPNSSAPLSASANASRTANFINHTPPPISTRNSGARAAAYIGGGVALGAAATAYAMSGAAAQAPTINSSAPIAAPTSITAPAAETATPKMASIKEKQSVLHFADQDRDFTLRQMKNSDGSTDIVLDMPANYADDNNMAARYEHAKDSVIKSILTNPELKSYRDEITKSGKMLINTGRETNIIVSMTINISDSGAKIETVAEANFANPAMVAMAHATVKNKFGGDYYKNFNMNNKA